MADPRLDKKFLSSSQRANRRVLFGSGGRQEDRGVTTSTSHSPPPSSSQTTTCTSIHLQHHQHYVSTSISHPNASTSLPARNPASSSVRAPVPSRSPFDAFEMSAPSDDARDHAHECAPSTPRSPTPAVRPRRRVRTSKRRSNASSDEHFMCHERNAPSRECCELGS